MTTDTRPPLYLTSGDAANWRRSHPEDADREIVIVESAAHPCPPEVVEAWDDLGRWEAGLTGGVWPWFTLFSRSFMDAPPNYVSIQTVSGVTYVTFFHDASERFRSYRVLPDTQVHPLLREHFIQSGQEYVVGEYT